MDGEVVQDSRKQPAPVSVPMDKLPPALSEIVSEMKAGEQRTCWLPEQQAPGGFIVADFELISFKAAPPAPAAPEDVAAAPKDALKTESGIAHKILSEGKGKDKPKATDTVKVHYSGWTTDGKMFDSSITRGEPAEFPLSGVIKGWTEGVQLMSVGEKRRFWIPEGLAYGPAVEGSGRPGGMLVFDIELLEIVR
jgi:peptidylprolyl isomerase